MKTAKLFALLALLGLAGSVSARESVTLDRIPTPENNATTVTPYVDDEGNYKNEQDKQRGLLFGAVDLRLGTISSTALYSTAAYTQFTFVFPNNVRKVKIQSQGGSSTNFCWAGWSSSVTGSAPTGGAPGEAYWHLPRIVGSGGGDLPLATVAQSNPSTYEWTGIQTRGGFSTLYCGCTDTAAIGIDLIRVEYLAP